MMIKKEHNSTTPTHSDFQIRKPRLLDGNGKRTGNSKITIYSHKYTNMVSTQSLPQDSGHLTSTSSTMKTEQGSIRKMDFSSKQLDNNSRHSESNRINNLPKDYNYQKVQFLIQDHINKARAQYQQKARQILDSNSRIISDLRQILFQQQKQLIDKQKILQQLIAERHQRRDIVGVVCNHKKLKLGEFQYLKDKVRDLEVKVGVVMDQVGNGAGQVGYKIEKLERGLIKYYGARLHQYKQQMQQNFAYLTQKLNTIQNNQNNTPTKQKPALQASICQVQVQVSQLRKDINSIANKDWNYQPNSIQNLQNLLFSLNQRIQNKSPNNCPRVGYYLEDDDQFFYPTTDRPYQPNDDYEHFQNSDEQGQKKKENCSPNVRKLQFKYSS